MFEAAANGAGGGGDFLGAETQLVGAAPFATQSRSGGGPRGRGGVERENEFGVMLSVLARERARGAEVARMVAAKLLQTLVKHRDDDFAAHRRDAAGGGFEAARTGENRDELEGQCASGGFGADEGGELGGIGGGPAVGRRWKRSGGGRPGCEVVADLLFEGGGGEVANGEEDGVVGTIPGFVKRAQGGGVGAGDHGFVADGISPRAEVGRVDEVFASQGGAGVPVIAGATLACDDAPFAFERVGIEGLFAGEFAQCGKCLVETFAGRIEGSVDLIDGVSGKRERGGVGAERDPVTLQRIDNAVTRKTTRAGEGHVFDEVRVAAFAFLLVERTGEDDQAKGDVVARLGVGEDDVAEAVGEGAKAGVRMRRKIAGFVRPGGRAKRCERKQSEDDKPAAEEDHRE